MNGMPLISGRGLPYQEKVETAEYRVVYSPSVAVRDKPWGKVIGSMKAGVSVRTTHKTIGLPDGTWVKTLDPIFAQTFQLKLRRLPRRVGDQTLRYVATLLNRLQI